MYKNKSNNSERYLIKKIHPVDELEDLKPRRKTLESIT